MKGNFERDNGGKKLTWFYVIAIPLVLLLCAGLLVLVFFFRMEQVKVRPIQTTAPVLQSQPAATEPAPAETAPSAVQTQPPHVPSSADYINILLVGQAARGGEEERFADSMILCTFNTYEKTLTLTSLLRDSLVQMPNYMGHYGGKIKLTTVYHLGSYYEGTPAGSMELMNQTLYDNFGIEVDHNFEVDFDAFIHLVDMLGGVDIELTEAEAKYLNNDDFWVRYDVEPGPAHLDGMAALCFARMRKAEGDGESDIKRTSRQQRFLTAVLEKVRYQNPLELMALAQELLPSVVTSMSAVDFAQLLAQVVPMLPELELITGGTCPAEYWGGLRDIYKDGVQHSVVQFDPALNKKILRAITEGETENTP